ncbi:MAG: exodeoxyribonuclease V subunit gamma [Ruminococcus flavefaciens]|nr:exodeoxyribonuclease V subunit gamma [Ruminococcus flavefaciens]MCM1229650.1 exodeoxyribonuclease V subunit gamma [Ruminococcus flavefaciens]
MIEFITGASGTGKTTAMFEKIRAFQQDGKDVCVLVPEQYSNDFDKKLYFFLGAENFNNLLSLSFSSLARQLFQIYGDPNRNGEYADEMARMIIIYQAISSAKSTPESLSFFARRSNQAGFAEEILRLITDMKHSGIAPQELMERAETLENKLHSKTADIASIYCEYERIMNDYGFKDNLENISESAVIANLNGYFKGKCVCLDEFESFNADQIEMLRVIFASAENVVITLRTDDVNAEKFTLFETVNSTYERLTKICRNMNYDFRVEQCGKSHRFNSPDLEYLSERVMRNIPPEPDNAPESSNIGIFEARDMYSEVEYVCAELKRLVHADKSLKYRDIAVISNNIEQYADVLRTAFERYDIPYFLSIERSINHTAIIVFFIALLDLLTARKFHTEQIFRLLKCGILEESLTDISILENYCYKWAIDGNVWCEEFTAEDDNLEMIESLRARIITPIISLKKKLKGKISAEKSCQLIYEYIVDCNAEVSVGKLINQLIKLNRDHEASELKRLWSCLINILDSIVGTIGENVMKFSEIANIMRSMIGRITYSVPPQTLDSVMTASARTARLNSPKVMFVIGATEGDFPNQVSLHGLFSEGDKQKLSIQGIEISRPLTDLIASERLIVYKSLSTASDRLYITYPLSDLSGNAKYPAPVISQITQMFRRDEKSQNEMIIKERDIPPDFYAVTRKSAYYHYMQDRSMNTVNTASIEKALLSDDEYRQKIISVLSKSLSKSEYKVKTETIKKLRSFKPLRLSPSGIEDYNECPFKYFCKHCLKLNVPEKIEINTTISGSLAHECFHNILASRDKDDFVNISTDELISEINRHAQKYRIENLGGNFSKTPRFELFYNKLKERLVNVFIHTKNELGVSDFTPVAFELDIQNNRNLGFDFGDGNWLSIGGIIDRADIWENDGKKYLRIIDYKSSKKSINSDNLANGLNLQMLLYLFMATEQGAKFGDCIPAGVMYTPVSISKIDEEPEKQSEINQKAIDKGLKSTGLLLDDSDVLNAMEKGIGGKYIPEKSVIPSENVVMLKDFVYGSVTEIAEAVYGGYFDALPIVNKDINACDYCKFGDICGNSDGAVWRETNPEKKKEADRILGKNKGGNAE